MVLPHWETRLSAPWSDISLSPDTELVLAYPNNAEHLARKWQVSISKWVFEPMRSKSPDLPKRETDALLIRLSCHMTRSIRMREVMGSYPNQVKPLTYKIDLWRANLIPGVIIILSWYWFSQYQDNMTEWNIESWCWQPGLPGGQHYKSIMSAYCHKPEPVLWCCYNAQP